ncbi:MAG: oxidoreductase, partial [Desulfovibrio sp.]|nr:oxidoreductase [Desulfovibrio sp.]
MMELAYGVWDGKPYDNRKGVTPAAPPNLDLELFDHFNAGNPTDIFLSDRGFLVFNSGASLLKALFWHFRKVASASCGKCSPCRAGAPLIRDMLDQGLARPDVDWNDLLALAEQMAATSLCGVGKTGPLPLIAALRHFPEELLPGKGTDGGFYTAITAPCIEACPGLVNIPRYIDYIRDGHDD